jgi:hypothetical protein
MNTSTLSLISALDGIDGHLHAPAALTRERDPLPMGYEAVWAPGQSGRVQRIFSPLGFDPRTVQLLESRYTGYAIPAQEVSIMFRENFRHQVLNSYLWKRIPIGGKGPSILNIRWKGVVKFLLSRFATWEMAPGTYLVGGWNASVLFWRKLQCPRRESNSVSPAYISSIFK